MGALKHYGLAVPGRLVLAHEPAFRIGRLEVDPSRRQVRSPSAAETIEPRVMQVLVVLAKAQGSVVTRDELTELCWDGRIVGGDSINRVLAKIRRLASGIGEESFSVETIARVGYRLHAAAFDQPSGAREPATEPGDRALARRPLLLGIGAVVAAGTAGAALWVATQRPQPLPLARRYFQRGMEARGQNSLVSGEQAVAYFRQATRIDPGYAEAWGALAWSYRSLLEYGPRGDAANITMLSKSAARRALEIDGDNTDAEAALLLLKPFYRNWAGIEVGLRRLVERDPDHMISRFNLAHVMCETGRWREAVPHFQKLAEREPFWPLAKMQLFRALFSSGRLDEAELQIDAALRLWPRRPDIWTTRVRHLLLTGRADEARALVENEAARPPDFETFVETDRLIVRAVAERSPAIRKQAMDRLLEGSHRSVQELLWAAVDGAFLGEVDIAFSLLEGYYFGRGPWGALRPERRSTGMLFNVMTGSLRKDPRFAGLVNEIGLQSFWRDAKLVPDYQRQG